MTGTVYICLHTNQSRSYLNHLVYKGVNIGLREALQLMVWGIRYRYRWLKGVKDAHVNAL